MNRILKLIRDYPWRGVWLLLREYPVRSAVIAVIYVLTLEAIAANADGYLEAAGKIIGALIFFAMFVSLPAKEQEEFEQEMREEYGHDNDED
ncbi:hypothetical protein [Dichotomicrobium thermohalophilum]|uniref:Uncharacterized protein n=1 Tax=Dichotomicrobium thermohalophilum TaxID=933063 RepID=A0A397Q3P0_9HYPH|nr:hypothetical protein [Dichotomicrobium thermohalophilum]RIA56140.1 hypothetical protein BXY53_1241 [Dichotomicrobium thermohalophilum]